MDWLTVFDPDPIGYKICLHTITVLSTPISLLGLYCVFWRSPKSTNKTFKILLGSSLIFSYISQFAISAGTAPVLVFPMTCGYPVGFFRYLGIPTTIQLVVTIQLVLGSGVFTNMLFFNRHHMLAPLSTFANYFFVLKFLLIGVFIPAIVHVILVVNIENYRDKQHFSNVSFKLCNEFSNLVSIYYAVVNITMLGFRPPGICTSYFVYSKKINTILQKYPKLCSQIPDFWDDVVLTIDPSRNQILIYMNVFLLMIAGTSLAWVTFFVSRIKFHLNTNMMSATTKAMHRAFVRSLVVLSAVHYLLILTPCSTFCLAFLFEWEVPGLSSVIFCSIALSDPCAIVSLIISHKEYRKSTLQLICNSKNKLAKIASRHKEVSSIMVMPPSPPQK